ncbi:MAG TPA: spermidine/putrescine ABC transporter permease PotC, partial [Asticcacaulis sp.]|nr:spermidine/putrescine ABC transporter permease PotC [Asticcacaulis sp.]
MNQAVKKLPPAPLEYLRRWPIQAWLLGVTLFLYVPLLSMMVFSFNNSKANVVWRGFTWKYYDKAFHDDSLITAFGNSLTIAACSTAISVVLGAMAAIVLWRFRFPGKTAFDAALSIPIVVPEICMGVGMLVFFAKVIPWPADLP